MEYILLLARLILVITFLVAAVGKFLDLAGSRKAMRDFGVPESLAGPAAILLPAAEVAAALLLIPTRTAWWGALLSLVLLAAFIAGIAYNMSKGRAPDCHCFGQIHSEPAGPRTLIRNGLLAALALFVLLFGTDRWSFSHGNAGASLLGWMGDLSTFEIIATIVGIGLIAAVAVIAYILVHLLGQNGRVLLRLDTIEALQQNGAAGLAAAPTGAAPGSPAFGLPVGTAAPGFKLEGLHGEVLTLDAVRSNGLPTMLLFTDPNCGPCNALLPDIGKWQREHAGKLNIALISSGSPEENRVKAAEHGISTILLQENRSVSNEYKAVGTPSAVLIDRNGRIASPVSGGGDAIRQLLGSATGLAAARPAAAAGVAANGGAAPSAQAPAAPARPSLVGQAAPEFELPDLDGKTVKLADFKGKQALLVFWNPGCGFCKKMTDDLKAWENDKPAGAPELVLVSTGTAEANKAMGLSSVTVLDEGFSTGRKFGATGTPSAILIDPTGKVASEVTVGGPNVIALASGKKPQPQAPAAPAVPAAKKGDKAPDVKLKDLDGKEFDLLRHTTDTLLVFWNPGCGFCKRMTDELKQWIKEKPKTAPEIVLVSTGTADANKAMEIPARILLDDGFATGRKFGAGGTPSAVLVDGKGKIASEVAVGAPAVMTLAGQPLSV
ncbi:MAG: redoxin domain-containing protein [Thermomicrobiales bacterium]|nr:redoxin domain-containing protein [Thermomicrobiales bacterium]